MIIAIEGIDGAGKNTLVTALVERLGAEVMSFPRYADSVHAQLAQAALYGKMGDLTDSAYAMATLFALDRREASAGIRRASESGAVVLLDRYVASNAAYSAARLKDDSVIEWVENLEFDTLGIPKPDLQILLNTSPELARERAKNREAEDSSRARDRYESDDSLQQRTSAAYGRLAERGWISEWLVLDPGYDLQAVCDLLSAKRDAFSRAGGLGA